MFSLLFYNLGKKLIYQDCYHSTDSLITVVSQKLVLERWVRLNCVGGWVVGRGSCLLKIKNIYISFVCAWSKFAIAC